MAQSVTEGKTLEPDIWHQDHLQRAVGRRDGWISIFSGLERTVADANSLAAKFGDSSHPQQSHRLNFVFLPTAPPDLDDFFVNSASTKAPIQQKNGDHCAPAFEKAAP